MAFLAIPGVMPAIGAGVGALGSMMGGKGAANAQSQAAQAAQQQAENQAKVLNTLIPEAQQLFTNYQNSTVPAENTLQSYLGSQVGSTYSNPYAQGAQGAAQGAQGVGSQLAGFNPLGSGQNSVGSLIGALSGVNNTAASSSANNLNQFASGSSINGLQNFTNPFTGSTIGALQNFNGLQPEQMAALSNQIARGGQSTINTLMSQLGGVANPAALAQSLLNQNQQNAMSEATQLGGQAAQYQLGGLQSAGQLGLGAGGQTLAGMEAAAPLQLGALQGAGQLGIQGGAQSLQGLESAGQLGQGAAQQQIGALTAGGNQMSNAGTLYSGLSNQNLGYQGDLMTALNQLFGLQTQPLSSGLTALTNAGNQYGAAANNAATNASSYGNPWGTAIGGLSSALSTPGLFGGGGGSPSQPISMAGYQAYNSPAAQPIPSYQPQQIGSLNQIAPVPQGGGQLSGQPSPYG